MGGVGLGVGAGVGGVGAGVGGVGAGVDRMLQVHSCIFAYFVLLVEKVPALETSVAAAHDAIQGEKIIVPMTAICHCSVTRESNQSGVA